ncbi:hypothetical protein SEA_SONALI_34 [Arthrobacter phage Sonali]|uniref:Uncharacterized protein n=1 Tax=Arthrobacter phage Sonali TaxID=2510495 RepID=A0A411CQR4_9CAUD|nr:hypothetical protein HOV09_gp34 [Arthrobacter phage Sonali]QAY16146.1 hypothetical protein SEA_SONALI_34 [Arthrobacter phage Sonali]
MVITYKRTGTRTRVTRDGALLGWIDRRLGSDSSPRGGAYRTFHHPITPTGERLAPCWSRKEAVEDLARQADKN